MPKNHPMLTASVGMAPVSNVSIAGVRSVSICERKKELKRRRHRTKKLVHWAQKLQKATVSEKGIIAEKVRRLTPGGEVVLELWGLKQR
jgi:hypothetical protein